MEQAADSFTLLSKEWRRRDGSLLFELSRWEKGSRQGCKHTLSSMMRAHACAALGMWLTTAVHVSAFASVPTFFAFQPLRSSNRHPAVILLQGGGLQGSPARQHSSSRAADQEHSNGVEGVDFTDEGASNVTWRQQQ